ncbi:hypothetical protein QKC54_gp0586 [Megavirus baoshan]|uniref:Uncharacterized protein n=1 Tax=Megavirus baoshan TaxID=2496520 RepID=A0A3S8UX18_9VIRU|nr:hypothetical protein QKC54_gp0586 [Megavirus baoshan]AZL89248.1 hypothetical protein Mb0486 [Megavirus baoshan]
MLKINDPMEICEHHYNTIQNFIHYFTVLNSINLNYSRKYYFLENNITLYLKNNTTTSIHYHNESKLDNIISLGIDRINYDNKFWHYYIINNYKILIILSGFCHINSIKYTVLSNIVVIISNNEYKIINHCLFILRD